MMAKIAHGTSRRPKIIKMIAQVGQESSKSASRKPKRITMIAQVGQESSKTAPKEGAIKAIGYI
eukprot:9702761-Karenia_brevis.AAC.1